jgi:uncharacterized protein (TIGR02231 family)
MVSEEGIEETEGVSVTYELPYRVSVVSRAEEQVLQIDVASLPADMVRVSVPILTDYVYRQVSLVNNSGVMFLPGPYDAYLDGQFVGQGMLSLLAKGEQLNAGLGVDPQVKVRRNLADKQQQIEGGNLVTDFSYEITVENFGQDAFPLELYDRIPYSKDGSIKVRLLEVDPPLSADPQQEGLQPVQGLLQWSLQVPGRDTGDGMLTARYRFEMAHDKQLAITGAFSLIE